MKQLLSILFLLVLISCSNFWNKNSDAASNNKHLDLMQEEFKKITHPQNTNTLAYRSTIGVFGNGNHCDFFCGEIRSYSGDKISIKEFYENQTKKSEFSPEIRFIDDSKSDFLCCIYSKLSDWGIKESPNKNMYLIMYFENKEANKDMRCH